MKTVRFQFDTTLVDLLPRRWRTTDFEHSFRGPQSVKHLVEALGVPHTEIGRILANGSTVHSGYLVNDGDLIYVGAAADRAHEAESPRFVVDGHLGRLSASLRMLGMDCTYRGDFGDEQLHAISVGDHRYLLTRDRRLLMRRSITRGYLVRSLEPAQQLEEVVTQFELLRWALPFTRCIRCNHPLELVGKEDVIDKLQPLTRLYFDQFHKCGACGQIYWNGSHVSRMQARIECLKALGGSAPDAAD